MTEHYQTIVVGGGIIGAAVFNELCARQRGEVLLIEKARIGQGATGWSGANLRVYHDDRILADMALEGSRYYQQFERHTGQAQLINRCGFLHFIYPHREEYARSEVERLAGLIEIEWIPKEEAQSRFAHINWDGLAGAVYERAAGFMDPVAVTNAWIDAGRARGGCAHEGVAFERLVTEAGTIRGIRTNLGEVSAARVVMCAGAWMEELTRTESLDVPDAVFSKAVQLDTFAGTHAVAERFAFADSVDGLYGRVTGCGTAYIGSSVPELHIDPSISLAPGHSQMSATRELGKRRFPWLGGARPIGGLRRFDAYTDSGRGVIGASGRLRGLFWATGFSGGGFKLAPSVARRLGDIVHPAEIPPIGGPGCRPRNAGAPPN